MEARYFRYQYENTQDGIIQSGCIWDRESGRRTTYLYMAGEYVPIPKIGKRTEGGLNIIPETQTLDLFVLGAYTIPYIRRLLELLREREVRTVVLPYIAPVIRLNMITYLKKNKRCTEEMQRFLGAPYSYLKKMNVEQVYLLYGNGSVLPRDECELQEGHYFEQVDSRIQDMITEMEGIFIPVYYAGYMVENQWLYYFGSYGVEMEANDGKLTLDTITMFTGMIHAKSSELNCMLTTKVFTREQRCSIQIKEDYENCALKCIYRNDFDMIKKHMDTKHEVLRIGLLNLGNVNLNANLKNVVARYGTVLEQVRGISIPSCGNSKFWDKKLLSVFTGLDLEYYICACGKNTDSSVIQDIVISSSFNRFINVNEEFAYCFSGYIVPKEEN